MADIDANWLAQFIAENGRPPAYQDYRAKEIKDDYPNLSWEQIYYVNNPSQAPRDYWGGGRSAPSGGEHATPEHKAAYTPVNTWHDWMSVYGSQTGDVNAMPEALKAMQQGAGAAGLWDKFINVALPNTSDVARQRLGQRFESEFSKYIQESQLRAQQGAEPLGWHNYLTSKAPKGLEQDWASISPVERGERPWEFSEKQRVQWR